MNPTALTQLLGNIDLYLLDQVTKGRYPQGVKILDAGCGGGRNLHYFLQNEYEIQGIDQDPFAIESLQQRFPQTNPENFKVAKVEALPYSADSFDRVICNAVLHFAASADHFRAMLAELFRVLSPGGHLFIRMTSDFGIADKIISEGNGRFHLPDGSSRFLLTKTLLTEVMTRHPFNWLEPLKTVNVNDLRCMSTLVLEKN